MFQSGTAGRSNGIAWQFTQEPQLLLIKKDMNNMSKTILLMDD